MLYFSHLNHLKRRQNLAYLLPSLTQNKIKRWYELAVLCIYLECYFTTTDDRLYHNLLKKNTNLLKIQSKTNLYVVASFSWKTTGRSSKRLLVCILFHSFP